MAWLLWPSVANAENYYWKLNGNGSFGSPQAACASKTYTFSTTGVTVTPWAVATNDPKLFQCYANATRIVASSTRGGETCAPGYTYDVATGICSPPTDTECKVRDPYTKVIQASFTDGGAVLDLDSEIKDGCVYEPGTPQNCTATQCDLPMTPVGNDDPSDNPEDPDKSLQEYLDELAKKFQCAKTPNGTVGCTEAQTTPPDTDPDNKCPTGYSWSGTACFVTPGGPADHDNSGGQSCGAGEVWSGSQCVPNNNGGGNGGGDNGGGNPGGGGDDGGGDGGGDNSGGGGDDGGTGEVSGEACDQLFKCSGDAIQCAIVRQTREQKCANEKFQDVDQDELRAQVKGDFSGADYQPLKPEGGGTDFSKIIDTSARFGGSCPVFAPVNVTMNGRSAQIDFSIAMTELCKYASWFSYLMVAFAMRRAIGIIAEGM